MPSNNQTKTSRRDILKTSAVAGAVFTAGCIQSSEKDEFERKITEFTETDGTELTINDQTAYLFGTRPVAVMNLKEPESEITTILDHLNRMGATLARIHAFQHAGGEESKQPEPGEINEEVMQRLDKVIVEAQNRGIRLSFMLINAGPALHISDTIDDNYGVNAHTYANYAESVEATEKEEIYNQFYDNDECKQLYKSRVEKLLNRENTITGTEYHNEPTIAFLELGNEIEYHWKHRNENGATLQPWITEVSDYIRTIDDNHLITTGEYGWAGRNNYVEDHEPENIDLCSVHYYPGPNGGYDLANTEEQGDHPGKLRELIRTGHNEIQKPVYVGEYNWKVEQGAEPPLPERNQQLKTMHQVMNETNTSTATFHALARDKKQDWERGSATVYADTDENTIQEFRRFAEQLQDKSDQNALQPLSPA